MRSISQIARRAARIYGKTGVDETLYEIYVEEAWRDLVREVGGVYTRTASTPLTIGQREFSLPARLREFHPEGIYLGYLPRTVHSAALAANVVTVETATAHGLAAGMLVALSGVDAANGLILNEIVYEVVSAPTTTSFTYALADVDAGDTDTATADTGQVVCGYSPQLLALSAEAPAGALTMGNPTAYYLVDDLTLAVSPVSVGAFPELIMVYDAEEADDLDVTASLPLPAWIEPGLMAYAAGQVGDLDQQAAAARFLDVIRKWREARNRRGGWSAMNEDGWGA